MYLQVLKEMGPVPLLGMAAPAQVVEWPRNAPLRALVAHCACRAGGTLFASWRVGDLLAHQGLAGPQLS